MLISLSIKYNLKYAEVNQKHANSHLASSKHYSHRYTNDFNSLLSFKETVVVAVSPIFFALLFSMWSLFVYSYSGKRERQADIMGPLNMICELAKSVLSNTV